MGKIANIEIGAAMSQGALGAPSAPRTEPGLVAAVHLRAIKAIGRRWSHCLANIGLGVTIRGVFCHQSPMVTYQDKSGRRKRCELADLLIVVDTQTLRSNRRKAALIQAKMATSCGTVSLKGMSSLTQLELYQDWPIFDFEDSTYNLLSIDLKEGTDAIHSGTFGVIDRHWHWSTSPRWTQHQVKPIPRKTKGAPQLGDYMAKMVGNAPAFGRTADARLQPSWSRMINSLLAQNQTKQFQHTQSLGRGSHPRAVVALATTRGSIPSFQTFGGDGAPPEGVELFEESPVGISTIHITVDSRYYREAVD